MAPAPSALPAPAPAATATPPPREWDAQSLLSDAAGPFLPPPSGAGAGNSPGTTVEYLRDLVQKRIITLTYMRNVHDGCVSPPRFFHIENLFPFATLWAAVDEAIGSTRS